jgi:hypothetical protein
MAADLVGLALEIAWRLGRRRWRRPTRLGWFGYAGASAERFRIAEGFAEQGLLFV